ncbi:MAG TPA: HupE/UreJ family protein [Steroidobacteraceae bacterium]|nr:HupE/UreJ family protein [Steroidobacteraceae bacterium]
MSASAAHFGWAWLGLALAALLAGAPAAAHTRSQSFSSWSYEGATLTGIYQVDAQRATQLGEVVAGDTLEALLASHLAHTVHVEQGGRACRAHPPQPLVAAHGEVRIELVFDCAQPLEVEPARLTLGAFFEVSPSHVHYARVPGAGGAGREALATVRAHVVEVGGRGVAAPTEFGAFFRLGLEHVLSGIDHLAFLVALALLAGSIGRAVWAATGFTLGHSLTLGLVTVGWLRPDGRSVEALIGFTVAFAAGEALASRNGGASPAAWRTLAAVAAVPLLAKLLGASFLPWTVVAGTAVFAACAGGLGGEASRRLAPALAAAFGLAHGAGFAGALIELDIPKPRLLTALLGFNLGVEAAQIVALLAIAALAVGASRLPAAGRRLALDVAGAALFAVGVYWFIGRSLDLGAF